MDSTQAYVLIGAVVVLFVVVFLIARNEVVKRKLVCPRSGETVDVEVKQRFEGDRKPVKVKACSAFEDPTDMDCEQDCIKEPRTP